MYLAQKSIQSSFMWFQSSDTARQLENELRILLTSQFLVFCSNSKEFTGMT